MKSENVKITARLQEVIDAIRNRPDNRPSTSRIIGCDDGNELIAIVNGKVTARYTFGK